MRPGRLGPAAIARALSWRIGRLAKLRRERRRLAEFERATPRDRRGVDPAALGRIIAFYLPQFHPIPENDCWWGEGFTEWTNVARARPQFPGHRQPRVPADLGFYDLRLAASRNAQADLAARFGIEAFCYWHYWFEGRRLIERPFDEVLSSGQPNFGFCLAWANESWTRTWLGHGEVLMEQTYSAQDDEEHARWLANAFADERYVRVEGRPVFLVYRPGDHPDPTRFISVLRAASAERNLEPPLVLGINGWAPRVDARTLGFDGTLDFQPQLGDLPGIERSPWWPRSLLKRVRYRVRSPALRVYRHRQFYERMTGRRLGLDFDTVPSLLVGWDNTPRRGERATVVVGGSPSHFRKALADHLVGGANQPQSRQLIFLNAWNEWAEGNYLEPDDENGLEWLRAIPAARSDAAQRLEEGSP